MPAEPTSRTALIALGMLVPAATIGVIAGMTDLLGDPDGWTGPLIYFLAKAWFLLLPAVWWVAVLRKRPVFPLPWRTPWPAYRMAIATGLAMLIIIFAAYWLIGRHFIDVEPMRDVAGRTQLDDWRRYLLFAFYLTFINALLEEYVWRWFVFRQCEIALGGRSTVAAVILAALLFTVHHTIALGIQFGWPATVLGSIGVFVAGAVWCWLYIRYRSVWACYISHVLADIGIVTVGWWILFG